MKTYGEYMKDILDERNGHATNYFDLDDIYECWHRKNNRPVPIKRHPRRIIEAVLAGLERSPYFEKIMVKDNGRQIRFFYLLK